MKEVFLKMNEQFRCQGNGKRETGNGETGKMQGNPVRMTYG